MRSSWLLCVLLSARSVFPADLAPAIDWVRTAGGSGINNVAAAAADTSGNLYIVGTTSSLDLPVVGAAQSHPGGSTLVRISSATGAPQRLYPSGFSKITSISADPRSPSTLYAATGNAVWQSTDAGANWAILNQFAASVTVLYIAVDPSNSETLYAGTNSQGAFKSTDGGHTWAAINNGITPASDGTIDVYRIWVDPNSPQTLLAATTTVLVRSADGGGSWTTVGNSRFFTILVYDPVHAGTLYLSSGDIVSKSTDGGQTFELITTPPNADGVSALVADSGGVLYAGTYNGLYQSVDSGVTWTQKASGMTRVLAVDAADSALYAYMPGVGLVRFTAGFASKTVVDANKASLQQLLVSGPNLFEVLVSTSDVFVLKLDPQGNTVYSTYFGGSNDDSAVAVAVGADGSAYVTGATYSADFPLTAGAFQSTIPSNFVFKLNPDGSLGWSSFFADGQTTVSAIAVDSSGNPTIAGFTTGVIPTTPGAYQTVFKYMPICTGIIGCLPGATSAFVTKFNAQGTGLTYSTYVSADNSRRVIQSISALALDAHGNVYFGGRGNIGELNAAGSTLLASAAQDGLLISAVALNANADVYIVGSSSQSAVFQATPGAFQTARQPAIPPLPGESPAGGGADAFVMKWDGSLSQILAATLLGGELPDYGESIAIDSAGNVIVSGLTDSRAFPTRAPFQESFSVRSGFVAELDANLSHLVFSTYSGDTRTFDAHTAVLDGSGNILIAGSTLGPGALFVGGDPGQSYAVGNLVVANKIALQPAPEVRLDSVENFASRLAAPIAPGEAILALGLGFGPNAQIILDGAPLATVSATSTSIVAVIPGDAKTSGAFAIQVGTSGRLSNYVLAPAEPASPGIFSLDASGFGQGYILNGDGTMNSPSNPATPGSAITIFATGAGPYTLSGVYAVTAQTPAVFVDGFYANGIAAVIGPVANLPGNVYQLSVYVPDPAQYAAQNPSLKNFKMPPQVAVKLVMGAVNSSNPNNSAEISQGGLVLNVKQ